VATGKLQEYGQSGLSTGRIILVCAPLGLGLYLWRVGADVTSEAWGLLLISCAVLPSTIVDARRGESMFGTRFVKRSEDPLLYWIAVAISLAVGLGSLIGGGGALAGYWSV
jgi:hypothetical protein